MRNLRISRNERYKIFLSGHFKYLLFPYSKIKKAVISLVFAHKVRFKNIILTPALILVARKQHSDNSRYHFSKVNVYYIHSFAAPNRR